MAYRNILLGLVGVCCCFGFTSSQELGKGKSILACFDSTSDPLYLCL